MDTPTWTLKVIGPDGGVRLRHMRARSLESALAKAKKRWRGYRIEFIEPETRHAPQQGACDNANVHSLYRGEQTAFMGILDDLFLVSDESVHHPKATSMDFDDFDCGASSTWECIGSGGVSST